LPCGPAFLDSISPVTIDPANPYLSFKLNDVDVFLLPEDRFQQAFNDPELKIQNGRDITFTSRPGT
jgi:hypothetical protein